MSAEFGLGMLATLALQALALLAAHALSVAISKRAYDCSLCGYSTQGAKPNEPLATPTWKAWPQIKWHHLTKHRRAP